MLVELPIWIIKHEKNSFLCISGPSAFYLHFVRPIPVPVYIQNKFPSGIIVFWSVGAGQVEKVDFFLGRFLKNSAANRLFRPKNQGGFLQNTVDTAFLEVLTSLELLDLDSMMMAITWRYFQMKKMKNSQFFTF